MVREDLFDLVMSGACRSYRFRDVKNLNFLLSKRVSRSYMTAFAKSLPIGKCQNLQMPPHILRYIVTFLIYIYIYIYIYIRNCSHIQKGNEGHVV